MGDISRRKDDHLDLTISGDVDFRQKTTLFECVRFVHDALPELSWDEIDLSVQVLGKRLRAPILIAAMTGGSERAARINQELAQVAEERGYAFGLGSQRAMQKKPELLASYGVRKVAPNTLVLGNLGIVQAGQISNADAKAMVAAVGADALCVHLNPAMELVQEDGDRDFRGCLRTLSRFLEIGIPIVVKETGSGLSSHVAARLRQIGVEHVDVSGAGGTSWVAVETHRASGAQKALGEAFWDWGIPTAASVASCQRHGFRTIFATGGLGSGVDVAKAIALGATAGGIARRALQALDRGGLEGARGFFDRVERELRATLLLTGSANLKALAKAPRIVSGELCDWLAQG